MRLNSPYLCKLKSYGYPDGAFTTGHCADGRQVVMGLMCPHLVAVFFDADGNYLETLEQLWRYPAPRGHEPGPYHHYDETFVTHFNAQLAEFQKSIGFREGGILLQEFYVGADCYFRYVPDYPGDLDLEDQDFSRYMEQEDERIEAGNWIFRWGEEYEIDADGEVVST